MLLTPHQQQAFDQILQGIYGSDVGVILLTGFAGTGKTFMLASLVDELMDPDFKISLATPTHKASRCLEKALRKSGAKFSRVLTVSQILGEKLHRDLDTGIESFVYSKTNDQLPGDLLIIDEASMVSTEAFNRLISIRKKNQVILFVGDPAQVPPVKDGRLCPVFFGDNDLHVQLTKVVRYDGPILRLATETRNLLIGRSRYRDERTEQGSVIAYQWHQDWQRSLIAAACSEESLANPDLVRAVCWTRKNVRELNLLVRQARYGLQAPPFCEGEVLIAIDAIPDPLGGRPLLYSSAEMRVVSSEKFLAPVVLDDCEFVGMAHNGIRAYKTGDTEVPPWRFWRLTVDLGDGYRLRFCVLDEDDRFRWQRTQENLAAMARKSDYERRKTINGVRFTRKDQFGNVQPATALTVHKSQGSTFQRVWVHYDTDGFGRPEPINNRLAYVAITRAAQEVHVIEDP